MAKKQKKTNFNTSTEYNFALNWADVDGRSYRQNILDLCNQIGRTKAGAANECIPYGPEYYLLDTILDDFQCEICMAMEFRKKRTAAYMAEKTGYDYDRVKEALEYVAWAGAAIRQEKDGEVLYWQDIYVPGHFEMVVNNAELVAKYPVLAEAFYFYSKRKGPMAAGIMPIGGGPMRVLPIERAIDDNSKRLSYEEVSYHLEKAYRYSVSDCSCRTSRESMGEGCGHLKEDMCIQMDHAADYYIDTGRGREITKEEAYEIIKKAEDNGLMHSVPNLDAPGHTHAICNCCGCGCYAVRLANEFVNNDMMRSNYRAVVDTDNCVACGECVESCPTNALRLGQKLCSSKPIDTKLTKVVPQNTEWTEDKMNRDYRINRKNTLDSGTAPCITKCPAHIPVQGYIKLASQGRYTEALELIKKHNPLPAVCGRVCPRVCEEDCTRAELDEAVAVDDVKKFIAQRDLESETRFIPKKRHNYHDKKIAIIGSGPTGLACAYDLAIDGYDVTVFEKQKKLGGMLMLGIPTYRLEKDVIEAEIDVIREMGVTFKTGIEVGKDISIQDLREQGFSGFYIAIGAQVGRQLGLEGEDMAGVISGVDFLRNINLGNQTGVKGKVLVLGGGNVAIDVARSAVRLGQVEEVDLYCLEERKEMPANYEEVEEALEEDVTINNSWGPVRVLSQNGKVIGVEFKRCISVTDENGRFNPQYDVNDTKVVPCDYFLMAVGQAFDYGHLFDGEDVRLTNRKTIEVDKKTLQTSVSDIFAGGDVAHGPSLAIDAIAAGKEAAVSLHRYVQKGQSLIFGRDTQTYTMLDKESLIKLNEFEKVKRQRIEHIDGQVAKKTFKDLRSTLTEDQIKIETTRCLGCGATIVDDYMCIGCGQCTLKCKFDAIKLERVHDEMGYEIDDLKKKVIKNAVSRKIKITANKINPFTETR